MNMKDFDAGVVREVLRTGDVGLLSGAFNWGETLQGFDYWHFVYRTGTLTPDARRVLEQMLDQYAVTPPVLETPRAELGHTVAFDEALKRVTHDRGAVYGHPLDDFAKVNKIKEAVAGCPDPEIRHALEMIGVKLARLAQTPDHLDSAVDIAGYARTICMIVDKRREQA